MRRCVASTAASAAGAGSLQLRRVWSATWRADGSRVFANPAAAPNEKYVQRWAPVPAEAAATEDEAAAAAAAVEEGAARRCRAFFRLYESTDGSVAAEEVPLRDGEELPFEVAEATEWEWTGGDEGGSEVAVWKPSGSQWLRVAGSGGGSVGTGWRHAATGQISDVPLPEEEQMEAVVPWRDLSFCDVVTSLSVKVKEQPAAGATEEEAAEAKHTTVTADAVRIRVDTGPVVAASEMLRSALCDDSYDVPLLASSVTHAMPASPHRDIALRKLAQAKAALAADSSSDEALATAAACVTHALRTMAVPSLQRRRTGVEAVKRPVLFRTHLLSLMFNPLRGLPPLLTPEGALACLTRTAAHSAAYEASKSVASDHDFASLSEAVVDVALTLRRQRETSRSCAVDELKMAERANLLQLSSAAMNAFLFWSSVRPGGVPITKFVEGILNGVFGSYEQFVAEMHVHARAVAAKGGWVWLAVETARMRRRTGDIVRFKGNEAGTLGGAAPTTKDIVPLGGTSVVLASATEYVRGRLMGFDVRAIATDGQTCPLSEGFYPLAGVEVWPGMDTDGRSVEEYVDAWLGCVDWRVVEFQIRTCYKERLAAADAEKGILTEPEYSCLRPLGSDRLHAVWMDVLGEPLVSAPHQSLTAAYTTIRSQLSSLLRDRPAYRPSDDRYFTDTLRPALEDARTGASLLQLHPEFAMQGKRHLIAKKPRDGGGEAVMTLREKAAEAAAATAAAAEEDDYGPSLVLEDDDPVAAPATAAGEGRSLAEAASDGDLFAASPDLVDGVGDSGGDAGDDGLSFFDSAVPLYSDGSSTVAAVGSGGAEAAADTDTDTDTAFGLPGFSALATEDAAPSSSSPPPPPPPPRGPPQPPPLSPPHGGVVRRPAQQVPLPPREQTGLPVSAPLPPPQQQPRQQHASPAPLPPPPTFGSAASKTAPAGGSGGADTAIPDTVFDDLSFADDAELLRDEDSIESQYASDRRHMLGAPPPPTRKAAPPAAPPAAPRAPSAATASFLDTPLHPGRRRAQQSPASRDGGGAFNQPPQPRGPPQPRPQPPQSPAARSPAESHRTPQPPRATRGVWGATPPPSRPAAPAPPARPQSPPQPPPPKRYDSSQFPKRLR
eukprot:Rhum_TRINITY_DN15125_c12_g2::Rhum_TRINITY_DN15125_c12_g2_i1::g.138220::m.138220